ncbi:MAG: carboxypeptidase regulatory-like domain-containing protein [Planctomycetes bacterium]|nr:carboxypeptidase regulatory-like domain-containing protein [Planctomycetota bacterium]
MRPRLAIASGALAVLALIGVTIAEMQLDAAAEPDQAGADSAPQASEASDATQPTAVAGSAETAAGQEENAEPDSPIVRIVPPKSRDTDDRRTRGLYIRPDGTLVGRVNSIDRNTLLLVPVPNALVSLVQDRKVIGQAVTDTRGMFSVKGLTAWGVYSVIVASKDYVCTFATVARPFDHDQDQSEPERSSEKGVGLKPGWVNEIQFVAMMAEDDAAATDEGTPADETNAEFNVVQVIPREDFIMALREGLFGYDASLPPPPGGAGGGGLGGGGGGGGAGGAGGGDGVIGAAIGAGIGAAIGAGETDNDRASPFRP